MKNDPEHSVSCTEIGQEAALVTKRLIEIEALPDGMEKELELSALHSFIDYRLKLLSSFKDEKYQTATDDLVAVCREHGFTPLYQMRGAADIFPSRVKYLDENGKFFIAYEKQNEQFNLFQAGSMNCLASFRLGGYGAYKCAMSPDAGYFAAVFTSSRGMAVAVFRVDDLKIVSFMCTQEIVRDIAVTNDGVPIIATDSGVSVSENRISDLNSYRIRLLDDSHAIVIGDKTLIIDLSDRTTVECNAPLSLDAEVLVRDSEIFAISGGALCTIGINGNVELKGEYYSHIAPPEAIRRLYGSSISSTNGIITVKGDYNEIRGMFLPPEMKVGVRFDFRNGMSHLGYHVSLKKNESNTIDAKVILDEYVRESPFKEIDPIDVLKKNGKCHLLVLEGPYPHLVRIEAERVEPTWVKYRYRRYYNENWRFTGNRSVIVDDTFAEQLTRDAPSIPCDSRYDENLVFLDDVENYGLKTDEDVRVEGGLNYISSQMLTGEGWHALESDKDRCCYYVCDGITTIGRNGCNNIRGRVNLVEGRFHSPQLEIFKIDDYHVMINADGSIEQLSGMSEHAHFLGASEGRVMFNDDGVTSILSKHGRTTLCEKIENHIPSCIVDDETAAVIDHGTIRLIGADGVREVSLFNDDVYTVVGKFKNLRFDLQRMVKTDKVGHIEFAELKANGEFSEKTDISVQFKDPQYTGPDMDEVLTRQGNDIIVRRNDTDHIRLLHMRISKDGLKDTNNVFKNSRARHLSTVRTLMVGGEHPAILAYSTADSDDETDEKHNGKWKTEVRLLDPTTGKRSVIMDGYAGYSVPHKGRAMMSPDMRYLAAECWDDGYHVDLWDLKRKSRCSRKTEPVPGRLKDIKDGRLTVIDITAYDQCLVVYDIDMNEISRRPLDVRMDEDLKAFGEIDGYTYNVNQEHRPSNGTVFWKVCSIEPSGSTGFALSESDEYHTTPCRVDLELRTLKDGCLGESRNVSFDIQAEEDEDGSFGRFQDESVKHCLRMTSYDGNILIQCLRNRIGLVRPELTFELTWLHDGVKDVIENVHNPRSWWVEPVASIGPSGVSYIEQSEDGLTLVLKGTESERRQVLPRDQSGLMVSYADEKHALLRDTSGRWFVSDWKNIIEVSDSKRSARFYDIDEGEAIFIDGRLELIRFDWNNLVFEDKVSRDDTVRRVCGNVWIYEPN